MLQFLWKNNSIGKDINMKKNLVLLVTLLVSIMLIVGCSKETSKEKDTSSNNDNEATGLVVEEDEDTNEDAIVVTTEDEEDVEDVENEEDTEDAEDITILGGFDKSLKDQALMEALQMKAPKSLYIVTDSFYADGTTATTVTYMVDDFMRNEMMNDTDSQVMIYNPDEGMTYIYSATDKTGMMMSDDQDMGMYMEDDASVDMDYEDFSDLVSAEVTTLNGIEVIYMVTESSSEGMTITSHNWISIEHMYPIKSEMYTNGSLSYSSEVTDIQTNSAIDMTLFQKPSDIEFIDFDSMGGF